MAHDDEDYLFALQLQQELDAEEDSAPNDVSKILSLEIILPLRESVLWRQCDWLFHIVV